MSFVIPGSTWNLVPRSRLYLVERDSRSRPGMTKPSARRAAALFSSLLDLLL